MPDTFNIHICNIYTHVYKYIYIYIYTYFSLSIYIYTQVFNKIILFNTAAFPPPYIPFRIRVCRWPVVGKIGVQGFNLFARAATAMATERKSGLPKSIADGFLFPYDSWQHRIAIYQFVKDIPLSPRHRTWAELEQIESGLASLSELPIMLIWVLKM